MDADGQSFLKIAEATLSFSYRSGGVTPIRMPHATGWRRCPELISAQIVSGSVLLQIEGQADRKMTPGFAFALPTGVHHRVELITKGEAVSNWSHVQFTILGSIDVSLLLDFPPILPRKIS